MGQYTVQAGEVVRPRFKVQTGQFGCHGAFVLLAVTLIGSDGVETDKTPGTAAAKIMRERAVPVNPAAEGTLGQAPAYSAAGGPAGQNIHQLTLGVGEGANFSVGDYIRKKNGTARVDDGVYKVLAITGDVLDVWAAQNEMDIANGDTIEGVTPSGRYESMPAPISDTDVNSEDCEYEADIQGYASADRNAGADPFVLDAFRDTVVHTIAPDEIEGVQADTDALQTEVADIQTDLDNIAAAQGQPRRYSTN